MQEDLGNSYLIHMQGGTLKAQEHSLRFKALGQVGRGRLQKVLNGLFKIPRAHSSFCLCQHVFFPLSNSFSNLHVSQSGTFKAGENYFCFLLFVSVPQGTSELPSGSQIFWKIEPIVKELTTILPPGGAPCPVFLNSQILFCVRTYGINKYKNVHCCKG